MEFKTDVLLHGGDYNPDQWLDRPDILERDAEMLAESGCNVVSLGIFAWSTLEPEEGVFRLDWMEQVIDRLYAKGIRVILATPSGARPKWLADKYPEVLRVDKAEGGSFSESVTITATPLRFTGKRCGSSTRSWQSVSAIIRR